MQHLVHTKELLAPILLMMYVFKHYSSISNNVINDKISVSFYSHNTHHYLEFFKAIRHNIANDTLPSLLDLVYDQQSKYDLKRTELVKMQSDSEEISSISTESSQSPFKKLKNAAND